MATDAKPTDDPAGAAPATREQIRKAVHDLRNGMNSLVMNAAVLGAHADDVPEPLRPFIAQIALAGRRCSDDLATLFALVDSVSR